MIGSSWLEDEPINDDRPMFGRNWLDETHELYYLDDSNGEMIQISNKKEYNKASDENNIYSFDRKNYNLINK